MVAPPEPRLQLLDELGIGAGDDAADARERAREAPDRILVGMQASDSGFQRYLNEYEGFVDEFLPFKTGVSGFSLLVHADSRTITDVVSSIVGRGLATCFPKLRILPLENGSAWVRPLVQNSQKVYARTPKAFDEAPLVAFTRCVWVHPFHEEDPDHEGRLNGNLPARGGDRRPHAPSAIAYPARARSSAG